jgi:hypothetical protein
MSVPMGVSWKVGYPIECVKHEKFSRVRNEVAERAFGVVSRTVVAVQQAAGVRIRQAFLT